MILQDIFELNDEDEEVIEDKENGIYKNKKFNYSAAENHAINKGKRLPDWEKYIDFLPGDEKNKVEFLKNVLGLTLNSYYWSSISDTNYGDYIIFDDYCYFISSIPKNKGCNLRCLKN